MLALYVITLGASSGIVGVFCQHMVASQGYAPSLRIGVILALGIGLAYASVQMAYMTFIQAFKPTRNRSFYISEMISHGSCVLLIPYLAGERILGSALATSTYAPIIAFGVFAVAHLFFKLMSFYAALIGEPAPRWRTGLWLGACAAAAMGSLMLLSQWTKQLDEFRPIVSEEPRPCKIGGAYAWARKTPEGSAVAFDLISSSNPFLTLRWADVEESREPLERIYVTVLLEGEEKRRYERTVTISADSWTEMNVASVNFPPNTTVCIVYWSSNKESPWQRLSPFRPIPIAPREVLLSGPIQHETRGPDSAVNIVLIEVEGLAASHVSHLGYDRDTTPSLDRMSLSALSFPNAYSPMPELLAGAATLLTGIQPWRHAEIGKKNPVLPDEIETLGERLQDLRYATAAFTEADASPKQDMGLDSGFAQGFDLYDTTYASYPQREQTADVEGGASLLGSAATLRKAQAWIDTHIETKFMVFVRLRELIELRERDAFRPGFYPENGTGTPQDKFDSALLHLDKHLGAFLKHIRDYETRKNTYVVITSPYGIEFSDDADQSAHVRLTEASLRVPLLVYGSGLKKTLRDDLVSLEDVAPTILKLAGAENVDTMDGRDFLLGPNGREPISVWNDPLAVTIRTQQWRFLWAPTSDPDSSGSAPLGDRPFVQLFDLTRWGDKAKQRNVATNYPAVVEHFEERAKGLIAEIEK